ncbi:nuclear transport factor 2 family protein [Sandaracinus amylolyticus]|uniref:nuclear transport factor 2 family protein n=1 Tax=Sandaracinus amylolyticus TaxID=927083 RepID=UPI00069CCCC5|nr:nuclear transport factor 2 family protein [Sandaracinus amylolyticus]
MADSSNRWSAAGGISIGMHTNDPRRALVTEAFARAAEGDFERFFAMMSDDCRWTISGTSRFSRSFATKPVILEQLIAPLRSRIEGAMRIAASRVIADGELVVVEARGDNVTKKGARYDNQYCFVMRFEGERVAEITEYVDTALVDRVFG